ncbi:MAG: hypothetical protein ABIV21_07500 [Pyrinomonadaceae bacterium]
MKFLIAAIVMTSVTVGISAQMSDAKFVGLKGKVRAVWTERAFTRTTGKQRLNKAELIKSLYYDKRGFLTRSSTFDGGESRRVHTFVGRQRRVDRFEFDAAGRPLPMRGSCSQLVINGKTVAAPNFDYFYRYDLDARKRIVRVVEYCDEATPLMNSVFTYNDRGQLASDIRCQPESRNCDGNYYRISDVRATEQRVTVSTNGVETCVSVTRYSEQQFDKKGNEIRRVGETTDCSSNKTVFYKFIDATRIEYY